MPISGAPLGTMLSSRMSCSAVLAGGEIGRMKPQHMMGLAFVTAAIGAFGTGASAQQRQKFLFNPPPGIGKYEEQHAIDVGDVQGHQLRVYSVHSVYTQEAPVYEGIKAKEAWLRAVSDYTAGSGHAQGYTVTILENGDKIFGQWDGITQTTLDGDGSRATKVYTVTTFTGGTGKFKGIRGTVRGVATTDFKTASGSTEGEYWMEQ